MVQEEPEEEEATLIIRPVKVDAQISLDERCGSGGSGQPFPDGFRGKPKKKQAEPKVHLVNVDCAKNRGCEEVKRMLWVHFAIYLRRAT